MRPARMARGNPLAVAAPRGVGIPACRDGILAGIGAPAGTGHQAQAQLTAALRPQKCGRQPERPRHDGARSLQGNGSVTQLY
jgi:hypothetical protein